MFVSRVFEIPEELSDRLNALVAEIPELDQDTAVSKAIELLLSNPQEAWMARLGNLLRAPSTLEEPCKP